MVYYCFPKAVKYILIITVFYIFFSGLSVSSQVKSDNELLKWTSWVLLQAIPSPTFFEDRNDNNSGLEFGLEWQVIPLSYSFNTNKYVSNLNFFYIKPSKRFSGSVELFFEPSYVTGNFENADLKKFMYKTGARVVLPVVEKGEYFSVSLGGGYYSQKTNSGTLIDGATYEAGVYALFGMMGLKFSYNQKGASRYSIGLYIKYY